jgi:purine-cytosine permease-like protein
MKKHQWVILIAAAIALGLAVLRIDVPSPPEWLVTWTGWVIMVVTVYFGPSVLLKLARS